MCITANLDSARCAEDVFVGDDLTGIVLGDDLDRRAIHVTDEARVMNRAVTASNVERPADLDCLDARRQATAGVRDLESARQWKRLARACVNEPHDDVPEPFARPANRRVHERRTADLTIGDRLHERVAERLSLEPHAAGDTAAS
jgi:hypothetical protein